MSDYQKYKESHLRAQKKYDDKNREKKREYDKKRWQERKAKYQELEQLQQENEKLKEVIDKAIEYIKIYRSYQKNDNKDYLKGRDEIGCLDISQVDELLEILKEVE